MGTVVPASGISREAGLTGSSSLGCPHLFLLTRKHSIQIKICMPRLTHLPSSHQLTLPFSWAPGPGPVRRDAYTPLSFLLPISVPECHLQITCVTTQIVAVSPWKCKLREDKIEPVLLVAAPHIAELGRRLETHHT